MASNSCRRAAVLFSTFAVRVFGLALGLGFVSGAAASAAEIVTIEDRFVSSSINTAERQAGRLLEAAGRSIPLRDVVAIRLAAAPGERGPVKLHLWGGGVVTGSIESGSAMELTLRNRILGERKVSLENFAAVFFMDRLPENVDACRYEGRILESAPENDVIHFKTGSRTEGFLEGFGRDSLQIQAQSLGKLDIPYKEVSAVRFTPAAVDEPKKYEGIYVLAQLADGSVIPGEDPRIADGSLSLRSRAFGELKIRLQDLVQLLVLGGRLVYLSDLTPQRVESTGGLVKMSDPYLQADRSWTWCPLAIAGVSYVKGLGVHSRCLAAWDIPEGMARFQSRVGLDDSARARAEIRPQVVFRVIVDGKVAFDSGPVGAESTPNDVDVELAGAKRVELVCDFGDNFDVLGRGVWANARFVKKNP